MELVEETAPFLSNDLAVLRNFTRFSVEKYFCITRWHIDNLIKLSKMLSLEEGVHSFFAIIFKYMTTRPGKVGTDVTYRTLVTLLA